MTTKGINKVVAKVEDYEGGARVTFTQQKGRNSDSINAQKMDYHIYDDEMNFEQHTIILNTDGSPQVVDFPGRKAESTYVLCNVNDEAYTQVNLSAELIQKFIAGDLCKIKDSINRIIVWRSLISMVKNLEIKSTEFFAIVVNNILKEDDVILLNTIIGTIKSFLVTCIPDEQYVDLCRQMFENLHARYKEIHPSNEDLRNELRSSMIYFLADEEHIKMAAKWLKEGIMKLDSDDKESILMTVYKSTIFTQEEKNELLNSYIGEDQSDRAKRLRLSCATAIPDKESKAKAWDIITHPKEKELSSYDYRAYLAGFYSRFQKDITQEYVEKYLEELPKFARSGEKDHMTIFTGGAFPPSFFVTDEFLQRVEKIVNDFEAEDRLKYDSFVKLLRSHLEANSGQKKIRELALSK